MLQNTLLSQDCFLNRLGSSSPRFAVVSHTEQRRRTTIQTEKHCAAGSAPGKHGDPHDTL
ncbi:MAG: hypothetical protein CMJ81_08300 [Planctomycetaceae bacterium]|nr:hypothetical protein [Planctomycetaceae bacterium]